jgi:hypothetical protein
MDAMPEAVWPGSVPNRRPQTVLRICYVDGCGGAPGAAFAAAASQGFSHVMLPPPWRVRAGGDRYLATDFGALAGDLGGGSLSTVAAQAAGAGVGLLLDVVLDRLDATSALLAQAGCPFAAPDQAIFLDPRRNTAGGAALAHLADPGEALVLATWWAERLRGWHKEGVAGFRLLGLGSIPAMLLAPFFTALREKLADVLLLPWTDARGDIAAAWAWRRCGVLFLAVVGLAGRLAVGRAGGSCPHRPRAWAGRRAARSCAPEFGCGRGALRGSGAGAGPGLDACGGRRCRAH